jgi:hypothetical protein
MTGEFSPATVGRRLDSAGGMDLLLVIFSIYVQAIFLTRSNTKESWETLFKLFPQPKLKGWVSWLAEEFQLIFD